jgi:hypothetical protein
MDKQGRYLAIRQAAAQLPATLASGQYALQPKYNLSKVGPDTDQNNLPKDRNVIYRMSVQNFDKAQKPGVVVEDFVWRFLPHYVDGMARLATDEEILAMQNAMQENASAADALERRERRGKYRNSILSVA